MLAHNVMIGYLRFSWEGPYLYLTSLPIHATEWFLLIHRINTVQTLVGFHNYAKWVVKLVHTIEAGLQAEYTCKHVEYNVLCSVKANYGTYQKCRKHSCAILLLPLQATNPNLYMECHLITVGMTLLCGADKLLDLHNLIKPIQSIFTSFLSYLAPKRIFK